MEHAAANTIPPTTGVLPRRAPSIVEKEYPTDTWHDAPTLVSGATSLSPRIGAPSMQTARQMVIGTDEDPDGPTRLQPKPALTGLSRREAGCMSPEVAKLESADTLPIDGAPLRANSGLIARFAPADPLPMIIGGAALAVGLLGVLVL